MIIGMIGKLLQKRLTYLEKIGKKQAMRKAGQLGEHFVVKVLMYAFLISVSFVLLYPLLYCISMAFRSSDDMYDPNVIWVPLHFTLENITTIWEKIEFPKLFGNTVLLCVGSALLQVVICAVTGYGFARFQFREKGIWMLVLILTVILPPQIASIPNYFMMKKFDVFGIIGLIENLSGYIFEIKLLDTVWAYFLPAVFGMGLRSGLFILIFRQFFRGLPHELEDSSYVDGAGPLRTFLKVMVPNCRAAVVVVFLFSLVWYWNDTYYGFMYMEEMETVSMRLSQISADISQLLPNMVGDPTQGVPYVQAGVLLSILPLLILYLVCQKVFVESVERVGIVG